MIEGVIPKIRFFEGNLIIDIILNKIIEEKFMNDLNKELYRTADKVVEIAKTQGIYFAVAFLRDSSYDLNRLSQLLPILQKTPGSIKQPNK